MIGSCGILVHEREQFSAFHKKAGRVFLGEVAPCFDVQHFNSTASEYSGAVLEIIVAVAR